MTCPLLADDDLPFDEVTVHVAALDADARVRASSERKYTVKPGRANREVITFLINEAIDLPAQPLTVRLRVSSRALGRAGTIQLPVDVPGPSDNKLQMGGVVIGVSESAAEPALGAAQIDNLVPFQPTACSAGGIPGLVRRYRQAAPSLTGSDRDDFKHV